MHLFETLLLGFAWLAILGGAWLGWQLLRQNGRILLRLDDLEKRLNELEFGDDNEPEGLPVGTEAPAFELPDLAGGRQSLAQFRGQSVLLVFFNPACGYCREMVPKLAALPARSSRREEAHTSNSQPSTFNSQPSTFNSQPSTFNSQPSTFNSQPKEQDQSLVTSAATNGDFSGWRPLVLILTTGDAGKNQQFFAEHKVACPVLLQNNGEVAKAYQVNGTPAGYLVSAGGRIASKLAIGAEALLELTSQPAKEPPLTPTLSPTDGQSEKTGNGADERANRFSQRSVARSKIKRDGLKAGTPAPDFRLPRLDGSGDLTLSELHGKRVLLVFSSPQCGPCNALAPRLEEFHREHRRVQVVMISKGEPKENRAKIKEYGLTFPVVLQQQWEISRRYAMFATPIAYLIDETGVIRHDVAVGTDAILGLLADSTDSQGRVRHRAEELLG